MRVLDVAVCTVQRILIPDHVKHYWKLRQSILNGRNKVMIYLKRAIAARLIKKDGAFIPICENIQPFITPHGFFGIFISQEAVIGSDCVIFHQVTIGKNTLKDSKRYGSPVIGNGCYIGAGAKIIGNIRIGDNVRIGANCCVVDDVPSNATVVMEKPRIILHTEKR